MKVQVGSQRANTRLNQPFIRFLAFLIILTGILWYLGAKWEVFDREVMVRRKEARPEGAVLVKERGRTAATASAQGPAITRRDFFIEARLERDRVRSEQIETLKGLASDEKASPDVRAQAQRDLLVLSSRRTREAEAEALLRAKGYDGTVVFLNEKGAVVVVRLDRVRPEDASRLADMVATATGVSMADVRIVPYQR